MPVEYDLVRKPNEKGDDTQQSMYPRIVSKGTVSFRTLENDIVQSTSFSKADVEGVLAALCDQASSYIREGYHVEFGKMGYLSAIITSRPVESKNEIRSPSISYNGVHFRPSSWFKGQCWFKDFERAKLGFRKSSGLPLEKRRACLENYLKDHPFITRKEYGSITGLLKNAALDDLNKWKEEKVLDTFGRGTHKVFILGRSEAKE